MYGDIIPPKKNSFIKSKTKDNEVHAIRNKTPLIEKDFYHTPYGLNKKSKWPIILIFITITVLSIVYYSVFNNKTYFSFESKSIIFEIKDNISMSLSEKNQNSSTTLSYNLIYANDNKDRNIFAPVEDVATTTEVSDTKQDFYILNATTTNALPSKKIIFINESGMNVPLRENTRIDVNGEIYYLQGKVDIKSTDKNTIASSTNKYKVVGFKGTNIYDKFYAIDYINPNTIMADESSTTTTVNKSNIPNEDILSLIPENFIPLKKGYIYDKSINQSALIVIDKKDFEKALLYNSKLIQDYTSNLKSISDLVDYEITINDYEMEYSVDTGLPISFKNLNIEIKPIIKKDKVASVFAGFSKDSINKIKYEIQKAVNMEVKYSPFWMSKVSDEDNISVEVK